MSDLDGVWRVRRTGGLLPPLVGVTKRISGDRGETRVGRLAGVPFVVQGYDLRYVAPFGSFVDRVQPHGDGFSGAATFRGRVFGRFELSRIDESDAGARGRHR